MLPSFLATISVVVLSLDQCHGLPLHTPSDVSNGPIPGKRPPASKQAELARWLVHATDWGTIATFSNGHDSGSVGTPFANPQSFSDGIANATDLSLVSTGIPYFLMTPLDETPQDIAIDPNGSFAISEVQIAGDSTCAKTDAEDPTCARISFTGKFVDVSANGTKAEQDFALKALYSRHPEFASFGPPGTGDHDFRIYKLVIKEIFFLDYYGGAATLTLADYFHPKASPVAATVMAHPTATATPYNQLEEPPQVAACYGHQEFSTQVYYTNYTECLEGNDAINKGMLKGAAHLSGCLDHYGAAIPYYSTDAECVRGNTIINANILDGAGVFAGCKDGALGPYVYPVFRGMSECDEAKPKINDWLRNH